MTRLILTASDSASWALRSSGRADIAIPFCFRFVWGPLPPAADLALLLEPRSRKHAVPDSHWLDVIPLDRLVKMEGKNLGLIDFCERFETVELWVGPDSNSQLTLIWLLDSLQHHAKVVSRLALVQADVHIANRKPEELAKWRLPAVKIRKQHLETAHAAWKAYCARTPRAWWKLLNKDLSVLPQLRQAVLELLEELPMVQTGLGATEMAMLAVVWGDGVVPRDVFRHLQVGNKRDLFEYWEIGSLLDGLAHCPAPAVSGLDEGPFTLEMHDDRRRHARYKRSKLKLTPLGKAILSRTDDFSRHNPIHRWWGGTELTNDRLWRWDPVHRELIAP
jgi:hypothetical protein